jgi:asparaginyl-tRNA synthetase
LWSQSGCAIDDLLRLTSDSARVQKSENEQKSNWQKAPDTNPGRYIASKSYFARIRVGGKDRFLARNGKDIPDLKEELALRLEAGFELEFLDKRAQEEEATKPQDQRSELGLIDRLKFITENEFQKLTYTEATDILRSSNPNKKKKFQYVIDNWGVDLQSEHERYLVEKHFKKPVIVTDYPKEIKAFYMRQNEDGKTVAAMDILAPGIGEIVGGSQREERLDMLEQRMREMHIPVEQMWWYLDTRRFGTVPHAGFGLGFERMVQFVTGMTNIRDVIPFPRTPGSAEF